MKTIAIEHLDSRFRDALEQQDVREAIPLTDGDGTVAWVLKIPAEMRQSVAGPVVFSQSPAGQVVAVVQASAIPAGEPEGAPPTPTFGAGRETLRIISEDDEHLEDFREHVE